MSSYTLTAKEQMVLVQKTYQQVQEGYTGRAYYWVGNYCVPVTLLPGVVNCTGKYKKENEVIYAEVTGKGVVGRDNIKDVSKWVDMSYLFINNPDGIWTWISQENLTKEKEILERISLDIHKLLQNRQDFCNYKTEVDAHYHKNWFSNIYPQLGDFLIRTRRSNSPPEIEHRVRYDGSKAIPGNANFILPFLWEKTNEEIDKLCEEMMKNLSQRIEFLLKNTEIHG